MTVDAARFDALVNVAAAGCIGSALAAVAVNHVLRRPAADVRRRVRSPVATASMLAFLVAVVVPLRLRLGVVPLAEPARRAVMLVGLALLAAGAVLNVAGRVSLGRNWADQVTVYRDQALVQRGAYALVRHPLYASITGMFLGAALIHRNAVVLGATLAVFLPAVVVRARQEERLLARRFPEYDAYRRRVGMLLPRPRSRPGRS